MAGTVAAAFGVGAKVGANVGALVASPGWQHTWHNCALSPQQWFAPSAIFVQLTPLMGLECVDTQLSLKQTSFVTPLWQGKGAGVGALVTAGVTTVGVGATVTGAGAGVGTCVGDAVTAGHDAVSVDEAVIRV